MNRATLLVGLCFVASSANAGEIAGRALDLSGNPIPNVIIRVYNEEGRQLGAARFAKGVYSFSIPNDAVPNSSQGITVVFSSSGRETVQVNLHARSNNSFNIVMPERNEVGARIVQNEPCRPSPCPSPCVRVWYPTPGYSPCVPYCR
jgi:hypothetical protein